MRHTSRIVHAVFHHLYEISEQGYFYLDASKVATNVGASRRSVYRAIDWLCRVNLLKCIRESTGRGRRSYYFLNWRKPNHVHPDVQRQTQCVHSNVQVARFETWTAKTIEELDEKMAYYLSLGPQIRRIVDLRAEAKSKLNCATLYKRSIKNQKTNKFERLRRHTLLHIRAFLKNETALSTREVSMCLQVIGKRLKSKPINYRTQLMDHLWKVRGSLATPKWCWEEPKKTYAWFGWLLKNAEKRFA
jgi:predicted transcriptional regulator